MGEVGEYWGRMGGGERKGTGISMKMMKNCFFFKNKGKKKERKTIKRLFEETWKELEGLRV